MSEHDRDDRGHFRRDNEDREYLLALADREPAGTSEIADEVGVTRQNADRRLRALQEEGAVVNKRVGNSLAWSLAEGYQPVRPVDPDDDFWEAETYAGEETSAEDLDDILYG